MNEINKWHHYQEAMLQWEEDIKRVHPVISHFPREQWPETTKFFGWLPLPPEKLN